MGSNAWIQGFSGGQVHPLEPDPSEFHLKDIARALSMLCRYCGHVSRFYSVGEHSVHVSRIVEARAVSAGVMRCGIRDLARWGLFHDATEAYLGDVTRPVKHHPAMAPYREAEARLMTVIATWAGLSAPELGEPALVKAVDTQILGSEVRQLKWPLHPAWGVTTANGRDPDPGAIPELVGVTLGVSPAEAEAMFLERYKELWP